MVLGGVPKEERDMRKGCYFLFSLEIVEQVAVAAAAGRAGRQAATVVVSV